MIKQRIQYTQLPGGRWRATVIYTLPDGSERSWSADAASHEISGGDVGFLGIHIHLPKIHFPKFLKQLASLKVLKIAALGLTALVPGIGPIAAAAAATAGLAGSLLHASHAHKKGSPAEAAQHAAKAQADALKLSGGDPVKAKALLDRANKARLAIDSHSGAATMPVAQKTDLAGLARAGKVRSSQGAPVSPAELQQAHSEGRIFWVVST